MANKKVELTVAKDLNDSGDRVCAVCGDSRIDVLRNVLRNYKIGCYEGLMDPLGPEDSNLEISSVSFGPNDNCNVYEFFGMDPKSEGLYKSLFGLGAPMDLVKTAKGKTSKDLLAVLDDWKRDTPLSKRDLVSRLNQRTMELILEEKRCQVGGWSSNRGLRADSLRIVKDMSAEEAYGVLSGSGDFEAYKEVVSAVVDLHPRNVSERKIKEFIYWNQGLDDMLAEAEKPVKERR